jgi:hypothetical protein
LRPGCQPRPRVFFSLLSSELQRITNTTEKVQVQAQASLFFSLSAFQVCDRLHPPIHRFYNSFGITLSPSRDGFILQQRPSSPGRRRYPGTFLARAARTSWLLKFVLPALPIRLPRPSPSSQSKESTLARKVLLCVSAANFFRSLPSTG